MFDLFGIRVLKSKLDGDCIKKGDIIFRLRGNSKDILLVERTALNLISRMSGITTLTREYVDFSKKILGWLNQIGGPVYQYCFAASPAAPMAFIMHGLKMGSYPFTTNEQLVINTGPAGVSQVTSLK